MKGQSYNFCKLKHLCEWELKATVPPRALLRVLRSDTDNPDNIWHTARKYMEQQQTCL
jgi:hypothetical protein